MCSEAPAFALLLVVTMFESLRSMAVMTQVRGQPTPTHSPSMASVRFVSAGLEIGNCSGTLVHTCFGWCERWGPICAQRSKSRSVLHICVARQGPPPRHLCCDMASGRAGLATGAARNGPRRQLFFHAEPRPHSTHYCAWAAPSRGGSNVRRPHSLRPARWPSQHAQHGTARPKT